eukprot:gnl/TRDRNA2_/TRDRNA2_69591_c0_seq1.p1 gnl/TRDRNA2_/TRDRNA2_69591_c0~~gnl/TRDRNA2_/TRDRNA2_69591_c0_seq1.p1  ORF type:complete len:107 (-),score=0.38 gnl/TRDRNA2_/TRDRNA2_69591_c0_seq1:79-399(-)
MPAGILRGETGEDYLQSTASHTGPLEPWTWLEICSLCEPYVFCPFSSSKKHMYGAGTVFHRSLLPVACHVTGKFRLHSFNTKSERELSTEAHEIQSVRCAAIAKDL